MQGHGFNPWSEKLRMHALRCSHTDTHTQSLQILRESVALPTPCFQTSSLQNCKKKTLYCFIAKQRVVIGSSCKRTLMYLLPNPHQISTSTLREKNSQLTESSSSSSSPQFPIFLLHTGREVAHLNVWNQIHGLSHILLMALSLKYQKPGSVSYFTLASLICRRLFCKHALSRTTKREFLNGITTVSTGSLFIMCVWKAGSQDIPGGPLAKTQSSQCRGTGFDPWAGKQIPHAAAKSLHAATKTWDSQNTK